MTKQIKSLKLAPLEIVWLARYGQSFTAQVREDIEILQAALRSAEAALAGKFTTDEACLVCDLLNGVLFSPQFFASGPALLAAEVEDGCALDGIDQKWQINGPALIAKCAALTPWEAYAVHHLARRFWAGPYRDSEIRVVVAQLFHC